ncbi:alanyl-tRNA editing protein [Jeotgalibacillus haloalkalitolerans]|uniref:DHHA1 domain-containing protein n=1 Tax=Jeotgalibacillus haloalkalitolerans TaxID=3104292 RepID=A0ABU5KIH4_9BACL|nr:DHHA1 domain-containing protein [Jeotgalibacillus sp. HH7-29]MDZ5711049.1 DHHA1 domain-containing protein [Jeotgalibacillus sp. HH7-29]
MKLFYENVNLQTFQATKLDEGTDEQGRRYIVLDQTAFYPTGGGQPHDTGLLNQARVYDVEEVDGTVRHYIEGTDPLLETVHGEIDWNRRFDHMQQHAGQHILSAAFENNFDLKTVSFHLGEEVCSIDLETEGVSSELLAAAEDQANELVLDNRPIETKWVSKEELAQYPLRKEVAVSDDIRLVIIPEADYNGCGGTHPTSTGQVGTIKILHTEKQRGHTRVYFVCGKRVNNQLGEKNEVIQALTAKMSAPQEKLKDAADRLLDQNRQLEKTVDELKDQLLSFEAKQYTEDVVKEIFTDRPVSELQKLAKMIVNEEKTVLFVNETDDKLQLVCGRGANVEVNMNQLVKSVLPLINGRGGGKPDFAQGGGEKLVSAAELLEACAAELL